MRFLTLVSLIAVSLYAVPGHAATVGSYIPANGAKDMAYDAQRDIVYITAGSQVLRYQVGTASFLDPISLGGTLYGVDLSPDGKTLAVADMTHSSANSWVHLVDLASLTDKEHLFKRDQFSGPDGTWAVAYSANGDLYVTGGYDGSGWAPMEKFSAATGKWSAPYEPSQNTMVSASGNGTIIAFAESNISDGRWGLINDLTGELVTRQWYQDGTSWFNYEIATNSDGTQFLIPTYGGGYVYDKNYKNVKILGTYAGQQPVGIAYDPVRHIAYMPWEGTSTVLVYDMDKLVQTSSLDFGKEFVNNGNFAFKNGRTRISRDGSLLMVQVTGGVQIDRLYAPLSASSAKASVAAGTPVVIPVSAKLGIAGDISFGVAKKPAHGKATVNGNTVVYTPDFSFSGTEAFNYQAHYSQAVANGRITVQVAPFVNHAPVATNDTIALHQAPGPVLLDVLANDSDPDGQTLSIVSATKPIQGTVAIKGGKILYTPASASVHNDGFGYTISDGTGGTASASVHVTFVLAN